MATKAHLSNVYCLETSFTFHTWQKSPGTSTIKSLASHQFTESMSGPREYPERAGVTGLKHNILDCVSRTAPYYHFFLWLCNVCLVFAFPKKPADSLSNSELKVLSGDDATSAQPLWVIDPLGQVISLARHPTHNTTRSLISPYLSPGMQPLSLKNTLSCNTLGKLAAHFKKLAFHRMIYWLVC